MKSAKKWRNKNRESNQIVRKERLNELGYLSLF